MSDHADHQDVFPGDPRYADIRARWVRAKRKVADLEIAGRDIAEDLVEAQRELQRLEDLARSTRRASAPAGDPA